VDGIPTLDALQLDQHQVFRDQIDAARAESSPLVRDRHRRLPHVADSRGVQLDAQGLFVDKFEQARTQHAMDFDRAADNARCERVRLCGSVALWPGHRSDLPRPAVNIARAACRSSAGISGNVPRMYSNSGAVN
jgi:hypothetical protein